MGSFSAAVALDGEPEATVDLPGAVALEQGLSAVAMALSQAGVRPQTLNRVAVGVGPGSFTGVRIAISYAKSLAQGWNLPLVGVNSFDALQAGLVLEEPVLAVVRGRPGVISVRLSAGTSTTRASGYVKDVLDRLGPASGRLCVVGDTQDVLAGLAERGWSVEPMQRIVLPSALAVAAVAGAREPAASFHEVRADYGELPPATVPNLPGTLGETSRISPAPSGRLRK